jgi:hypothetical protein
MPAENQPSTLIEAPTPHQVAERILTLRGAQVLLDRDLAVFFEVKPIRLREQVKRNANRFPPDFIFQLTRSEVHELVSQNAIPSSRHLGGYLPYAFTEEGVAALTAVLRSERAVAVGIQIMRAFVAMRKFILHHAKIFERLDQVERRQIFSDHKIEEIFSLLESHGNQPPAQGIFFNGQIFDAYAFVASLIRKAKSSIILVDNYVDESVLLMLSKRQASTSATIFTRKISRQLALDLEKHNAQYPPVAIHPLDGFHDRFLIIDKHDLYHLGASLKDLGKQCFAFSKIDSLAPDILSRLPDSLSLKT